MPGSRVFAAAYSAIGGLTEKKFAHYRYLTVGDLSGRVLEIGAGTGANLSHYQAAAELTVTDFSPHMLKRLRAKLQALGVKAEVMQADAGKLPFPDESFDSVVATLVLCSVRSQSQTLAEVRRVLRPGGELRFFEHIRSKGGFWAWFQRAVGPVYTPLADGCEPDRDTVSAIAAAGFRLTRTEALNFGAYPIRPFVVGAATKNATPTNTV